VPAVYTVEASFLGDLEGNVYTPCILKSIGRDICRCLIPYCNFDVPFTINPTLSTTGSKLYDTFLNELKGNEELLNMGDVDSSEYSGSDSCPSDDNLPSTMINRVLSVNKKQYLIAEKKILRDLLRKNEQLIVNNSPRKRNIKVNTSLDMKTQSIQDLTRHKRRVKTIIEKVEEKKSKQVNEHISKKFTFPIMLDVSSQTENKYSQYFK